MSTKALIVTGLSCIATGVLVGILTAPASGKETRKKISDKADDLTKKFNKLRGKGMSDLGELKQIFETEVDGLKEDVRERILHLIEAASGKIAEAEKKYASAS